MGEKAAQLIVDLSPHAWSAIWCNFKWQGHVETLEWGSGCNFLQLGRPCVDRTGRRAASRTAWRGLNSAAGSFSSPGQEFGVVLLCWAALVRTRLLFHANREKTVSCGRLARKKLPMYIGTGSTRASGVSVCFMARILRRLVSCAGPSFRFTQQSCSAFRPFGMDVRRDSPGSGSDPDVHRDRTGWESRTSGSSFAGMRMVSP